MPGTPKFGRLLTALVTPFTADDKVDYVQAQKLARTLLDSGSDGFIVSGTTGEAPTLAQYDDLLPAARRAAREAGLKRSDIAAAIKSVRRAG